MWNGAIYDNEKSKEDLIQSFFFLEILGGVVETYLGGSFPFWPGKETKTCFDMLKRKLKNFSEIFVSLYM